MNEQDAYFTHTIVGAPFSMLMGRRMRADDDRGEGLILEPEDGSVRLAPAWQPWVIDRVQDWPAGLPRRRPRGMRRWLERHAFGVALLGTTALAAGLALVALAMGLWPGWPA